MTRRYRPAPRFVRRPPTWRQVRAVVRCAEGDEIQAPAWALFWPYHAHVMVPPMILCEVHAHAKGYPPRRPFVMRAEAVEDVKARQVGDA